MNVHDLLVGVVSRLREAMSGDFDLHPVFVARTADVHVLFVDLECARNSWAKSERVVSSTVIKSFWTQNAVIGSVASR